MVIPRSRSSGALSIESNDRNLMFGLCFDSTLVIAAVSVVLPWSMWPIVPMFTCGLVRSNFFFAISLSPSRRGEPRLLPSHARDDLARQSLWYLVVRVQLHRRVRRATL